MGCTAGLMMEQKTSLVNISALRHYSGCLSEDLDRHSRADAWDGLEFSSALLRLCMILDQSTLLFSSAYFVIKTQNSTFTCELW